MRTRPQVRDDLALVSIGDEMVAYDPRVGAIHYLDPTAALVLQLCDGTATVQETIHELAAASGVAAESSLEAHVHGLVRRFREAGLLGAGPPEDGHAAGEDGRARVRREVPTND